MLTDIQKQFVDAAKAYEAKKNELQTARDALDAIIKDMPLNSYCQDPATMVVYKIHKPIGTFMYYRDIDYKRTALVGETASGTNLAK